MSEILSENDSFLNFCFLTTAFYSYIINSGKNYEKINNNKNEEDINKKFEKINEDNFLDFLENKSYLILSDEEIRLKKLELIKSVFHLEFNENEKEKIFLKLSEKMNISIFANKNKLIKLLSDQIINFIFEIFELYYLIIKNMEKCEKDKFQQMKEENNFLKEKIKSLEEKIEICYEENLNKKNKGLDNQINKLEENKKNEKNNLKDEMKNIQNNVNKIIEDNLLNKEITYTKESNFSLISETENLKQPNSLLINKIGEQNKINFSLYDEIKELKKSIEEQKKTNSLLNNEIEFIKRNINKNMEQYKFMENGNFDLLKYNERMSDLLKENEKLSSLNIQLTKINSQYNDYNEFLKKYCKDLENKLKEKDK